MSKFKSGDRVRYIKHLADIDEKLFTIGEIYTLQESCGSNTFGLVETPYFVEPQQLELVEKKPKTHEIIIKGKPHEVSDEVANKIKELLNENKIK